MYQMPKGRINGVILDWAGTAVDFGSKAPAAVFVALFKSEGIEISSQQARSGMGLMKKDHLRKILSLEDVHQKWMKEKGADVTAQDIDRLFEDFIPLQSQTIADHAIPIPGLFDTLEFLRGKQIKIGTTTGYLRQMMDILVPRAAELGYHPDSIVCPDEVPAGRPYPWMCYRNAINLDVYPMSSMVKVGDTTVDIEEGINAGMWTVGLAATGNLLGLGEEEYFSLSIEDREKLLIPARQTLIDAGAHYVIDGIWDLANVINTIQG
jgi:phosphonoacetaldehyde hydrolase